jgi:YD repeat-containing protein
VRDFDENGIRQRISLTGYTANPSRWVIVPPGQSVFDGGRNLKSATFSLYAGHTDPDNQTLSMGRLTSQRSLATLPANGCDGATVRTVDTADTTYGYHATYPGNVTSVNTYAGYGSMQCSNNNWHNPSAVGNGSQARTTVTGYDNNGLFPTYQRNALDHPPVATTYDSNFPWLPATVTDSNAAVTRYGYDGHGRLTEVAHPGDALSNPTINYDYNDPPIDPSPDFSLPPSLDRPLYIETRHKDQLQATVRRVYDGLGRLIQEQQLGVDVDRGGYTEQRNVVTTYDYDGLGHAVCQTAPYDVSQQSIPNNYYYDHNCTDYDHTRTTYNGLRQPVTTTAPDGSVTSNLYFGRTSLSLNPEEQIGAATVDTWGQLAEVEEFDVNYDAFTDGSFDTSGWYLDGTRTQVTQLNGEDVLQVWGNKYWEGIFVRRQTYDIPAGGGATFRFRLAATNQAGRIGLQTDKGGHIGIIFHAGNIYPDYNIGAGDEDLDEASISQQAGVWYRAQIVVDKEGRVDWRLWQEDDPGNRSQQFALTLDTTDTRTFYNDANYRFFIHSGTADSNNATLYLSDYWEGPIGFTRYQYDTQQNLTHVTDALGNVTHLVTTRWGAKSGWTTPIWAGGTTSTTRPATWCRKRTTRTRPSASSTMG